MKRTSASLGIDFDYYGYYFEDEFLFKKYTGNFSPQSNDKTVYIFYKLYETILQLAQIVDNTTVFKLTISIKFRSTDILP